MIEFYFISLCFLFFLALMYICFRGGMYDYFRLRKISKTKIRKSKKGAKNYWWYEQLHVEYCFSKLYYLNKSFTIIYLSALILHIFFGWIKIFTIPIGILIGLCAMFSVIMIFFTSIYHNKLTYGVSIVWFKQSHHPYKRGFDSIVLDVFGALSIVNNSLCEVYYAE